MTLLVAALAAWAAYAGLGLGPPAVLTLVGLAVLAWQMFAAVFWPFTPCPVPVCEKGKVRRPGHKSWRRCSWCGGSGSRIRWGRRLYEAVRPTKHGRR